MVSIRLSDEEFLLLKGKCQESGARTLSDLARDAMHRVLEMNSAEPVFKTNGHGPDPTAAKVQHLEGRLEKLQSDVFRLTGIVEDLCKSN